MFQQVRLNLMTFIELRRRLRGFSLSPARLLRMQLEKARSLLVHCQEAFPFYRHRFAAARFDPRTMRSLEELRSIPPLTKEEYRDFTLETVQADPGRYERYFQDGTSGSTGLPLKIYRTETERAYMLSKYLRALFLNGHRWRDRTFCLPSPHRLSRSDSFVQRLGLLRRDCVAYTAPAAEMVAAYRRQPVDLLYANRSHLVMMAEHIKAHGLEIDLPRLVCSSSEMMDAYSRNLIEEVFGPGRLFEVYGAVEFNNLAFQIRGESCFRFNHDTDLLELENKEGQVNPHAGHCLVTDLHIRSFPLVRYRLDDWIEMEKGDGVPRIRRIIGRRDDRFILANGERKSFHPVYEIMEKEPGVRQFRFIQESPEHVDVQLVVAGKLDRNLLERRLRPALDSEFNHSVRFRFHYFDALPLDPSGKLRMVVSKVRGAQAP